MRNIILCRLYERHLWLLAKTFEVIKKLIFICGISILFSGCLHQKTITAWKIQHIIPRTHNKILVVGIIKDSNDSLRMKIEDGLVKNLSELDYYAVSALKEFGPKGLSDLGQEATYTKLCNNGVDAVMTIALIDKFKQKKYKQNKSVASTNYYYYERIWNYRNMLADLSANEPATYTHYLWEGILFDLRTLEPLCVVQTRPFEPGKEKQAEFASDIFAKMKKEKILNKQNELKPKPF